MRPLSTLLPPLALTLLLGACQAASAPSVGDGWVRLAAAPGRPAAGYFTLTGGPTDATLTAVRSPAVGRIELHESMKMGGSMQGGGMAHMTMRPIAAVAVPAGGTVAFAPGGRHLMLFDVAPTVKPGDRLRLDFSFADGSTLTDEARVIAAGDAAPTQ